VVDVAPVSGSASTPGTEITVRRWHTHTGADGEIGRMLLRPDGVLVSPNFGEGYKLDIEKRYTFKDGELVRGQPTTKKYPWDVEKKTPEPPRTPKPKPKSKSPPMARSPKSPMRRSRSRMGPEEHTPEPKKGKPPMQMYLGRPVPAPGHPDYYDITDNKGKAPPWQPLDPNFR
jgi:hypothetical protein